MKLQSIFDSITPDNIKGIPLIEDAMKIFIQNLEDNSDIAVDIRKIFDKDNTEIRENLLKIYLSSLYSIITNVQQNKDITDKFEEGEGIVLEKDINEILNDEYFTTNKEYKQRVGTKLGIDYTYLLAKYMQTNEFTESDFALNELQPFHFQTEGTIYRELYENVVKPLAHPIGFTYIYNRLIRETLVDLFGVKKVYDVSSIEVRCLSGYYDVFTPDNDDTNIKADFLNRINPLTAELFTEEEYNEFINVRTSKVIEEVEIDTKDGNPHKEVLFTDGTLLEAYTNPIRVYYRNYIDELLDTNNYITQYTSHCSLFIDYTETFEVTYTDEIVEFLEEFTPEDDVSNFINETADDLLLLSVFSDVGYYFHTDDTVDAEGDGVGGYYFKLLDYIPVEYNDSDIINIGQFEQIKYTGTTNPTGVTGDYYIHSSSTEEINIGTTDFNNMAIWTHVGSEPKHDWYLITQS